MGALLNRSSGGGGGGGGTVTDVTASLPLISSGGATPNISITAGANTGDVYSWGGAAFNLTPRVLRATGLGADTGIAGIDFRVAAGGDFEWYQNNVLFSTLTKTVGGEVDFSVPASAGGLAFIVPSTGQYLALQTKASDGLLIADSNNVLWRDATGAATSIRTDTLSGTAIQYQWGSTITAIVWNTATKGSGTGASLQIVAGATAGANGGALDLRSGGGASAPGVVTIRVGSSTAIGISNAGAVTIGVAASSNSLGFNGGTSASASAGGAGAIPNAEGYINCVINGVARAIPYVNP